MCPKNPKVGHFPLEIAGQVGLICRYLRQENISAAGYNYFDTYLKYSDVYSTDVFELIKGLPVFLRYFDMFHFHNSLTITEDFRDIRMIKDVGKKMIMHHRGNDVRFRTHSAEKNPWVYPDCSLEDEQIHDNLTLFAETMDAAIVQDHELYQYVSSYYMKMGKPVYVLPRLIDTGRIQPRYPLANQCPLIVHAPTHRAFKGSDIIEDVISRLSKECTIEYMSIEGSSHQDTLKLVQEADIVIDQILCGAYGNVSVEAMALGKPVICYIRPDLVDYYPDDLPIISANPETLYSVLKQLVSSSEQRIELGKRGRSFVEGFHEGSRVITQLVDIYNSVL
jgi:glycosyltransferase involved in cell wall biosynthesis